MKTSFQFGPVELEMSFKSLVSIFSSGGYCFKCSRTTSTTLKEGIMSNICVNIF